MVLSNTHSLPKQGSIRSGSLQPSTDAMTLQSLIASPTRGNHCRQGSSASLVRVALSRYQRVSGSPSNQGLSTLEILDSALGLYGSSSSHVPKDTPEQ
jgi:hypothetical protein